MFKFIKHVQMFKKGLRPVVKVTKEINRWKTCFVYVGGIINVISEKISPRSPIFLLEKNRKSDSERVPWGKDEKHPLGVEIDHEIDNL